MHLTLGPVGTRKAAHARSASQPCHSPPVLVRLDGCARALRAWSASPTACGSGGLALVEAVLAALRALLELPLAAAALRAAAGDRLLDGFLVLADAYGTFESALLALKQSAAELRTGVRRGDGAAVAASLRARRQTEKELRHLAAAMRHAAVTSRPADATDGEVADVVAEAAAATAAASEAIFLACAGMSPDVPAMVHTLPSNKWLARLGVVPAAAKKAVPAPETATVAALERLEECIDECGYRLQTLLG